MKAKQGWELNCDLLSANEVVSWTRSILFVETYERDVHSDTEAERQIARPNTEPILSKYVRRHHPASQIIGDRNARHMKRSKFRSTTCLLNMKEPKIVNESLEDDNRYKAMEEEIQKIEKNNTWSLVPRPKDKNVMAQMGVQKQARWKKRSDKE